MVTPSPATPTAAHQRGTTPRPAALPHRRALTPALLTFSLSAPLLLAFIAWQTTTDRILSLLLGAACCALLAFGVQTFWQLRQSRRTLAAAISAKADFLANISHEIRTPMNGLLGMTSLLLESPLTTQQRNWAETTQQSAEALLDVINDLVDIAKIQAGELALEAVPFDLHDVMHKVTDLLALRAREKGLQLLVDFQRGLPRTVVGDALRLRQILVNLVGNAIKFTDHGTVVIRVLGMTLPEQKIRLFFAVEDTGVGITPEQQTAIFAAFAQEQSTTTRRFGGLGLGLTIGRYLIEQFGGNIDLQSEPGKGSTFSFTLIMPLAQAAQMARPDKTLQGARALVVEPLENARGIIVKYLASWGMSCDAFASTSAALKHCQALAPETWPRFALLDGDLPHDGCWALANQLQTLKPGTMDILVVLAPNIAFTPNTPATRHVAGVLRKPLYPTEMQETLLRLWHGASADPTAKPDDAPSIAPIPPSVKSDHSLPSQFPGIRVLLVEDQPVNQLLMKSILEKSQCVTDLARNGVEAVAKYGVQHYDLIFMDCQMPEMDGFQATQEIRRLEAAGKPRTPIVAVTADAMKGDRDKCLAIGMDDYLNKPVQIGSIHAMLHKYTSKPAAPLA